MRTLVVALALLLAACSRTDLPSSSSRPPPRPPLTTERSVPPTAAPYAQPPLSARVEVPSLSMAAGSSLQARVVVDNQSGRAVQATGCGQLFAIALGSPTIQPIVTWTRCLQLFTIPVGESSYPVTVEASYLGCISRDQVGHDVACLPDGRRPALPPGDYQAMLYQNEHVVPTPPPVAVRVTHP